MSKQLSKHQTLNEWLDALNQYKIDLGLDRLKRVLKRLNLDSLEQTIITVGGTNGKGSTVAAVCALLNAQSIRFGAFTSPHIFNFNERINVNGQWADDAAIMDAFEAIEAARAEVALSYFEFAFLAALLVFVAQEVDVLVIEVGLGGRLDAANVLDADAAIITTVDIDHIEWLGDDIESIAAEKAGILRQQQVSVYGDQPVPNAIKQAVTKLDAQLWSLNQNYHIDIHPESFDYRSEQDHFRQLPKPALKGDWQIKNFASALTALLGLGYRFSHAQLQQALAGMQLKGRLETVQTEPQVLADVAHNQQAVTQLAGWLKAHPVGGQTRAVFSVLKDKQLKDWLGVMDEVVDHWLVFELPGERAMKADELLQILTEQVSLISRFDQPKTAYKTAKAISEPNDRIVVFGSFHVLDEVFK